MKVPKNLLLPVIAVTAVVLLAGCPLPYDFKAPGASNAQASDPSSPNVTAPVVVSYSVQGGSSGTVADSGSFYSGETTTVTLSTATAGAVIFYTDSSAPFSLATLSSAKKINGSSGTMTITRTTTVESLDIHAVAIGPNMLPSTIIHAIVGVSPYPILSVTRDNASMSEDGGTATFTITSSSAPTSDITVHLATSGDAAANYVTAAQTAFPSSFTATLKQSTTTVSLPITGVHDADGINETVTLTIQPDPASPTTYSVGAPASASVVIQDDHTPVLTITPPNPSSIPDNGAPAVFIVTASFAPATALTVRLVTGGFYKPTDISGLPSQGSIFTLTLPAGATTVPDTVTPHPDVGDYANQTVTVSLVADTSYTIGSSSSATLALVDTSPIPTLTLTADRTTMADGDTATLTVSASAAPEVSLQVNLSSSGYTAGTVTVPTSVTLPVGATSATFPVTAPVQGGYTLQTPQVSLVAGTGYVVGSPGAQSIVVSAVGFGFSGLWDFASGGLSSIAGGAPAWAITGSVPIVGGSLSFSGNYSADYVTDDVTSALNQNLFTVGVGFRLSDVSAIHPIIAGGFGSRWLILESDTAGNLSLHLNNHAVVINLPGFHVTPGTDHTIIVAIDLAGLLVHARLDNITFDGALPAGFVWNNTPGQDLVLTSNDFSSATAMAGLWHWIFITNQFLN